MTKKIYPVLVSAGDSSEPYKKTLVSDFSFTLSNGAAYTVEAGFNSDLASVPRREIKKTILFLNFVSWGLAMFGFLGIGVLVFLVSSLLLVGLYYTDRALTDEAAFIVHDWFYKNRKRFKYSRAFIDQEMRELMKQHGASEQRQFFIYWAVRMFGGIYWGGRKN